MPFFILHSDGLDSSALSTNGFVMSVQQLKHGQLGGDDVAGLRVRYSYMPVCWSPLYQRWRPRRMTLHSARRSNDDRVWQHAAPDGYLMHGHEQAQPVHLQHLD